MPLVCVLCEIFLPPCPALSAPGVVRGEPCRGFFPSGPGPSAEEGQGLRGAGVRFRGVDEQGLIGRAAHIEDLEVQREFSCGGMEEMFAP